MRRGTWISGLLAVVLAILASSPSLQAAKRSEIGAEQAAAIAARQADPNLVSFEQLINREIALQGPYDREEFSFAIPASWRLQAGTALELDLSTFFTGPSAVQLEGYAGLLAVSLNDERLTAVEINRSGEQTARIEIPFALLGQTSTGRDELSFELDMGFDCDLNQQANVVIRTSSGLILPHGITAMPTDLSRLPRPIYQRSFELDSAVIVVPDQPSAAELQAALTTAAAFGRTTDGNLLLGLTTASQLSAQQRDADHLILVGLPNQFGIAAEIAWSAPPEGDGFRIAGIGDDDGVLQMAASPWNDGRVVLFVSGNSPIGVVKAAQALSNNSVRSYLDPSVAVIAEIRETVAVASVPVDRSFADLGYEVRTISSRGSGRLDFTFEVPQGRVPSGASYVRLRYSHAAQMDFTRSGADVLVNGQRIGSIVFSPDSTRLVNSQFDIPASAVRAGTNYLTIDSDLEYFIGCTDRDLPELWMSLWPESLLHLPLQLAGENVRNRFTLADYPSSFVANPDLGETAFILAENDPIGWASAAAIAYDLGEASDGQLALIEAAYGNAVADELTAENHLILVGRASQLGLIETLNPVLPAPFEGSDFATERRTQVLYRLPPNASVGYLQALNSPWEGRYGVMTVLGSDTAAVSNTTTALITPGNRSRISGNLMIVNQTQLIPDGAEPPAPVSIPETAVLGEASQRPAWLLPAILLAILLFMGVGAYVIVNGLRQRRTLRAE